MVATPPNKKPLIRRTVDRSRQSLTGGVPPRPKPKPVPRQTNFNKDAWVFNPDLMEQKYAFTFTCSSCTGLPPYTILAPVKPFIEAVVSKPGNHDQAKAQLRDRFRALISSQSHVNQFTSDHIRTIGDNMTVKGWIPFNPFRPYNDRLRSNHQGLLDQYVAAYKAFLRDGSAPEVEVKPLGKPAVKVVSVQGAPVSEEPEVVVKSDSLKSVSIRSVNPDSNLKKLSYRKTMDVIGEDKELAQKYLDLEVSQAKPRSSVLRRLKQIVG